MGQLVGQKRCLSIDRGGWTNSATDEYFSFESSFGVENASPDWKPVLVGSDGMTVDKANDPFNVDVQDCSINPPKVVKVGETIEGAVNIGFFPGFSRLLLDWINARDSTTGESKSATLRYDASVDGDPSGGLGYKYLGAKVNTATLAVSRETLQAQASINVIARERSALSSSSSVTFTSRSPYLFKNATAVLYDSRKPSRYVEGDVEGISFEINNNLEVGPKKRAWGESPPSSSDADYSGLAESIRAGRQDITGTVNLIWKTAEIDRLVDEFARLIIIMGFVHPSSKRAKVTKQATHAQNFQWLRLNQSPGSIYPGSPGYYLSPLARDCMMLEGRAVSDSPNSFKRYEWHTPKISYGSLDVDSPAAGDFAYNMSPDYIKWGRSEGTSPLIDSGRSPSGIATSPGFAYTGCMEWVIANAHILNANKSGANTEGVRQTIQFQASKNTDTTEDRFGFSGEGFQYSVYDHAWDL